jgi:hypothetical protein
MVSLNPTKNYKRPFIQFVKKARKPLQLAIEDAVEAICADPDAGEPKVGDLAGVRIYKFRFNRQEYLIAYRSSPKTQGGHNKPIEFLTVDFHQVGLHENF